LLRKTVRILPLEWLCGGGWLQEQQQLHFLAITFYADVNVSKHDIKYLYTHLFWNCPDNHGYCLLKAITSLDLVPRTCSLTTSYWQKSTGNQISGQQGAPLQLTHLLGKMRVSWFNLAVVHINTMEYSPFWEDDSLSASQEMFYMQPKFHYHIHKSPTLDPLQSHLNRPHTLFLYDSFQCYPPSVARFPKQISLLYFSV
jgi:hypothetical protein